MAAHVGVRQEADGLRGFTSACHSQKKREGKAALTAFQPEGWRTVTPRIFTDDVRGLAGFMRAVFGATGRLAAGRPMEMRIGDSIVMVSSDDVREALPACLHVYVEDADRTYRKALGAGAKAVEKPVDTPYGDRRAVVKDAWGNTWQIATRRIVERRVARARSR